MGIHRIRLVPQSVPIVSERTQTGSPSYRKAATYRESCIVGSALPLSCWLLAFSKPLPSPFSALLAPCPSVSLSPYLPPFLSLALSPPLPLPLPPPFPPSLCLPLSHSGLNRESLDPQLSGHDGLLRLVGRRWFRRQNCFPECKSQNRKPCWLNVTHVAICWCCECMVKQIRALPRACWSFCMLHVQLCGCKSSDQDVFSTVPEPKLSIDRLRLTGI